jgi:hypothetical protein
MDHWNGAVYSNATETGLITGTGLVLDSSLERGWNGMDYGTGAEMDVSLEWGCSIKRGWNGIDHSNGAGIGFLT